MPEKNQKLTHEISVTRPQNASNLTTTKNYLNTSKKSQKHFKNVFFFIFQENTDFERDGYNLINTKRFNKDLGEEEIFDHVVPWMARLMPADQKSIHYKLIATNSKEVQIQAARQANSLGAFYGTFTVSLKCCLTSFKRSSLIFLIFPKLSTFIHFIEPPVYPFNTRRARYPKHVNKTDRQMPSDPAGHTRPQTRPKRCQPTLLRRQRRNRTN